MTPEALLLRINQHKYEAVKYFANNPYVTIHSNTTYSGDVFKNDPYTVWVDLNFPVWVIRGGKPVKVDGIKDISIHYPMNYPKERPSISCYSELICSIHAWKNHKLCLHARYNPAEHNLIKEICHVLGLAANCPETIDYTSTTPDMRSYATWTKEGLKKGIIPTVPYKQLIAGANTIGTARRRVIPRAI